MRCCVSGFWDARTWGFRLLACRVSGRCVGVCRGPRLSRGQERAGAQVAQRKCLSRAQPTGPREARVSTRWSPRSLPAGLAGSRDEDRESKGWGIRWRKEPELAEAGVSRPPQLVWPPPARPPHSRSLVLNVVRSDELGLGTLLMSPAPGRPWGHPRACELCFSHLKHSWLSLSLGDTRAGSSSVVGTVPTVCVEQRPWSVHPLDACRNPPSPEP